MKLAEKGKLNIDDCVKHYLSDFPCSSDITVRQLMAHSAGIPNPIPLVWMHLPGEYESYAGNDFFKPIFIKNNKAKSKPNEKFSYSNLGYILLGQFIENVSGMAYKDYINNNILRPLDNTSGDLGFTINTTGKHAKGYHKQMSFSYIILRFLIDTSKYMDKAEGKWKPFKNLYVNGASYGGLVGTPDAFVKYIQILLKPDCKLITDDYKKMLFAENHTNDNKATGMCLLWFSGQLNGNRYFAHAGGGGYYCEIRIYPQAGIGSVIMFNRSGMKDERFFDKVDKYYMVKK